MSHFICSEMKFLVRAVAAWNNLMVDKALCKSTDGSFGRSTVGRKGIFITRVSVLIRTKLCPFLGGSGPM